MANFVIPTSTDPEVPFYDQVTALGGSDYRLALRWNARNGTWAFSIATAGGDMILEGIPCLPGLPLWFGILDSRLPPGDLYVIDRQGGQAAPGLHDLGSRVVLLYSDPE